MLIKNYLKLKNPQETVDKIVSFIVDEMKHFNASGVIFGLSGGIDSSLVAYLLAKALPKEKIQAVFMGERDSNKESLEHARLVSSNLGINLKEVNITSILKRMGVYALEPSPFLIPRSIQERYAKSKYLKFNEPYNTTFVKSLKGGEGNPYIMKANAFLRVKHRLRAILLYFYGEQKNFIVAGCCNKTEKLTGYFVKYGDGACDFEPIAHLYKTQVYELAKYLHVPEVIISKPPSPDLAPGITDEFALQISYEKIDTILYALENDLLTELHKEGILDEEIEYVKLIRDLSKHMRSLPHFLT
ncbi:MAG: NAD(+) synthase [Caldisericaceae bacterium]